MLFSSFLTTQHSHLTVNYESGMEERVYARSRSDLVDESLAEAIRAVQSDVCEDR